MATEITSQNTSWIHPSLIGTWKMGWVIMLESLDDVFLWMNDVDAKTQIGSNAVRQGGKFPPYAAICRENIFNQVRDNVEDWIM